MGLLDRRPCVAARIGIYGHYWQLEAESVFVLPQGLEDALKVLVDLATEPEERETAYGIHSNCAAGTG
jgi:hypothetical protein